MHTSSTEDAWLTWFREGRSSLQKELEQRFAACAPAAPSATDLLAELPRNLAHSSHLLAAQQLPFEGFYSANALEMLCYLSLQSLPRHSRLYANLHLDGEWHDGVELRAVHHAMLQHEPSLLKGKAVVERSENRMSISQAMDVEGIDVEGSRAKAAETAKMSLAERIIRAAKVEVDKSKSAADANAVGSAAGGDGGGSCGGALDAAALSVEVGDDDDVANGGAATAAAVVAAFGRPKAARAVHFGADAAGEGSAGECSADDDEDAIEAHAAAMAAAAGLSPSRHQRSADDSAELVGLLPGAVDQRARHASRSPSKSPQRSPGGRRAADPFAKMTSAERWAFRQAEVDAMRMRKRHLKEKRAKERSRHGGGGGLFGALSALFGGNARSRTADAHADQNEEDVDEAAAGWIYVDDFGREQGPFTTERLRTWLRKGYLTSERKVRHADRPNAPLKFLCEWPELDVLEISRRARSRWQKANRVVSIAAQAQRRAIGNSSDNLDNLSRAAQQRYARSAFGFDSVVNRIPYFRSTPLREWPPALVDAVVLIADLSAVDQLSHIIGHYDGHNLGAEMVVELLSLGFWYMRPMAFMAGGLPQVRLLLVASGCVWLRLVASDCVWLRLIASDCV